jgi:hypothetical protein
LVWGGGSREELRASAFALYEGSSPFSADLTKLGGSSSSKKEEAPEERSSSAEFADDQVQQQQL